MTAVISSPAHIFNAALDYWRMGYSVIPCHGKKASISTWAVLQKRRPTRTELWGWYRSGAFQNVAIVCGSVSGGLVVIDLDGDSAVAKFKAHWPHLTHTWAVRSGSGHGLHLYLKVDQVPPTTKTAGLDWGNVEVRSNGAYIVAPPSIHPGSGQLYAVETYLPVLRLDNLNDLCAWVRHENASKRAVQPAPKPKPAIEEVKAARWAQAALAGECANVRSASSGSRNDTLNRAAFKMGQLVHDEKLSRTDVEAALFIAAAALVAEDGEAAVNRTIRSGIAAGIEHPRSRS